MRNFCNLIGLEQEHFSLIWDTHMWKLKNLCGYEYKQIIAWFVRDIWHKYHSWYFKIASNFNFEISVVVFMPSITTNHAITYRVFSLTWPASMQIYWNKRKRLHKKRVQLPQDWFGTPTWPPWRHVKTLHTNLKFHLEKKFP